MVRTTAYNLLHVQRIWFFVLFLVLCAVFSICEAGEISIDNNGNSRRFQPSLVRTELKVSRSLDPRETETINVKSNTGGYASIIVKKRNGNSRRYYEQLGYNKKNYGTNNETPLQTSSSIRFAEPTDQKSIDLIKYFMDHFDTVEKKAPTNNEAANINDRKPVQINLQIPVPDPVVISSNAFYVKDANGKTNVKKGRSLQHVGTDGIPVVEGIRVPDDEEDKRKVWRNARVIKGELYPYEKGYKPAKVEGTSTPIQPGQIIFRTDHGSTRVDQGRSFGPFTKSDNFPKAEESKSFGPFSVNDNRQADYENYHNRDRTGPFFVKDNARTTGARLIDYIKQINDETVRRDYFLRNMQFESEPRIQRRMLQNTNYGDESISDLEGSRTPVFEYAHPELGIATASSKQEQANEQLNANLRRIQYYTNIPTSNQEAPAPSSLNSQEYYQTKVDYSPYTTFPQATYPYNHGYLKRVAEVPMWRRVSDQVRDRFQTGISVMEAMARPVFEPIVEASQKISKQLGFSQQYAQNKIGVVGPAAPALIPALGLVAGGAALGIGAIAVGRYFDENLLQRSDNNVHETSLEHKRSFDVYPTGNQENYIVFASPSTSVDHSQTDDHKIMKRALNSDIEFVLQNVEVDAPTNGVENAVKPSDWKNAECAKKMFCEIMVQRESDDMVFMQKRIEKMLSRLSENARLGISQHLSEVTNAINRRSCFEFYCNRQKEITM